MNSSPKISVIVPVYNAVDTLITCVNSVIKQSLQDIEILLINDGSTDNSSVLCEELSLKDKRIKVFQKKNGGVSSARQLGISKAIGMYSIHIDSDDWIEESMLEDMYSIAIKNDCDIVTCDYIIDFQNKSKYMSCGSIFSRKKGYDLYRDLMLVKVYGSCVNKLVRHDLYRTHKISFPLNINFGEDWYINILLAYKANNIAHIEKGFYHYVQNKESITHQLKKDSYLNRFKLVDAIVKRLSLQLDDPLLIHYILILKLECFNSGLFTLDEIFEIYPEYNQMYSLIDSLLLKHRIPIWLIVNRHSFFIKVYRALFKIALKIIYR